MLHQWQKNVKDDGLSPVTQAETRVTDQRCAQSLPNSPGVDSVVCTSSRDRVCNGDSGGYLGGVTSSGRFAVVGVAAFVSAQGVCEPPSGYSSVSHYAEWIIRTANAN